VIAVTLDLIADLTDQAIDLFDRLVGSMFRKVDPGMPGPSRPMAVPSMRRFSCTRASARL
jgi:hypothetical protein